MTIQSHLNQKRYLNITPFSHMIINGLINHDIMSYFIEVLKFNRSDKFE